MTTFQRQNYRPWDNIEKLMPDNELVETKTVSKALANREQSVSKESPKPLASSEQTVSTNKEEKLIAIDTVSKALAQPLAIVLANSEQSVSEALANSIDEIVGKEKKLLIFIFTRCQLEGSCETSIITTEEIRKTLEIKANHLRNLIFRLTKKGFIQVSGIKNGRSGWRKFKMPKDVFRNMSFDITVSKALANREQSVSKESPKPLAEPLASISSSSSNNLNNINTTTTELPPEWEEVDLSELHKRNIRLGKQHLVQHWEILENFSALDFQESIDGFIFDLEQGHFKPRNSLGFLLGVIQKGGLYAPSDKFVSPQRQQITQMLELAKKRQEEAFLAWVETNEEVIAQQIAKHQSSLAIDFKVRGRDSLEWVRHNMYKKG
jgi:hypothetical protein